ncbi:MAG: T9SS type A sorting domain-containing protein [Saprospiraceae bacterium]|nr:T9SS type A sorting domain-containing protein [Saprospiraceae bacterium]
MAILNVVGEANIHADNFSTAGRINAGSLVFSNKPGDGPEFFPTSCTVISGAINVDAQVIFNGYLETSSSVTFSNLGRDNGAAGTLVVRTVVGASNSSISAGGYYKGDFYDNDNNGGFTTTPGQPVTAASHGFDVLQILSQGQNLNNINVLASLPLVCSGTIVPIILSKFTATKSGTQSNLNWVTASEENAAFIEVERSSTGIDEYVTLGKLEARNAPGQYDFTDNKPNFGHNYYRLKLVDLDETFKYSGIQLVTFSDPNNELSVYPNPFNDQINIKGTFIGDEVTVYGLDGKILQKISMKSNEAVINGSNMANGIYLIVIKSGADIKHFKMIKS